MALGDASLAPKGSHIEALSKYLGRVKMGEPNTGTPEETSVPMHYRFTDKELGEFNKCPVCWSKDFKLTVDSDGEVRECLQCGDHMTKDQVIKAHRWAKLKYINKLRLEARASYEQAFGITPLMGVKREGLPYHTKININKEFGKMAAAGLGKRTMLIDGYVYWIAIAWIVFLSLLSAGLLFYISVK